VTGRLEVRILPAALSKRTDKMRKSEIEKAGLEKEVIQLYTEGKSYREIADIISGQTGTRISFKSVARFIKKQPELSEIAEVSKKQKAREIQDLIIDTKKQLKEINDAALYVMNAALEEGDYTLLLKAIREVANQLELQAKLIEKIPTVPTVVNIIVERARNE